MWHSASRSNMIRPMHGRIEGYDLLRGVAILLVMLRHSWPEYIGGGGIVGVVIFFTLSGYLITGLLAADIRKYGKVRYARFYRNRAVRLLPALVFLLLGYTIVEGVLGLTGSRSDVGQTWLVAMTYSMNVPFIDHGSPTLSHLWTLANEEQFYIIWPLLLVVGIRFRKTWVLLALAATGIFVGMVLGLTHWGAAGIYNLPIAWTIAMLIGAGAKLGEPILRGYLIGWRRAVSAVAAVGVLGVLTFLPDAKDQPLMYLLGGPAIGLATVCLILPLGELVRVPSAAKWLVWLGTISYAAYLWNYPIRLWTIEAVGGWYAPLTVILTVVAATVSWFMVERPANRLKTKTSPSLAEAKEGDAVIRGKIQPNQNRQLGTTQVPGAP